MKFLDFSFSSPAENLACDEALLEAREAGTIDETLRFWESPQYFVVVGYGNSVATETRADVCAAKQIPILRRCSGGGTVVQGPGCLNYSLILNYSNEGPLRNITAANQFIMERNRAALEKLTGKAVAIRGHTDLAIDGVKFSGNAQRRKKRTLLFHGALLLNFDLALISELLPMPSQEPDYRLHRPHQDFLQNLELPAKDVKNALRAAWQAREAASEIPSEIIASLARDKYVNSAWNLKF
ncbi:MAG TPA: lipoate--protein ligase family protein [Verrucomicrobiae bacterium]|nr:lipoate--protein ligase family protein [Verrucomicrobiae bacterium]